MKIQRELTAILTSAIDIYKPKCRYMQEFPVSVGVALLVTSYSVITVNKHQDVYQTTQGEHKKSESKIKNIFQAHFVSDYPAEL